MNIPHDKGCYKQNMPFVKGGVQNRAVFKNQWACTACLVYKLNLRFKDRINNNGSEAMLSYKWVGKTATICKRAQRHDAGYYAITPRSGKGFLVISTPKILPEGKIGPAEDILKEVVEILVESGVKRFSSSKSWAYEPGDQPLTVNTVGWSRQRVDDLIARAGVGQVRDRCDKELHQLLCETYREMDAEVSFEEWGMLSTG